MDTAETCRERAAEDRARADRAETPLQRNILLQSAHRWDEMATLAERMTIARVAFVEEQKRLQLENPEKYRAIAERNSKRVRDDSPRSVAQKLGHSTYTTGKPCKRGHVVERWTSTGTCVKCAQVTRVAIVRSGAVA